MTSRILKAQGAALAAVAAGVDLVLEDCAVAAGYSPQELADARAGAENAWSMPRRDCRDIELVTIDPAGSLDLDQAVYATRRGDGYRVMYAIADVAAFVAPGSALDAATRGRAVTIYAPDRRLGLHPPQMSEDAASLLAGQDRPAVLWTIDLDSAGDVVRHHAERAVVRSRKQWSYEDAQAAIDSGSADATLLVLAQIGPLRQAVEIRRGGVDLPLPEQVVEPGESGMRLEFRRPVPLEGWNAQISLLTGMCAAETMLGAGVGILRTMPPPGQEDLDHVRRVAAGLGLRWPGDADYASLIRSIDPAKPHGAAFLTMATSLLRGAGYTHFDGADPEIGTHSAVAAPYAHVTAPLRRLVDRFATEVVLSVIEGQDPPSWVREALPAVGEQMRAGTRVASKVERECLDLMEALVMAGRVGHEFDAVVVGLGKRAAEVIVDEPAMRVSVGSDGLGLGDRVRVRLTAADPVQRRVEFDVISVIR